MHRRHFLASLGVATAQQAIFGAEKPDYTLQIAPASIEIALARW
jgi:hypothetical protein